MSEPRLRGSSTNIAGLAWLEYTERCYWSPQDQAKLEKLMRGPSRQRLRKVRNLKRCPRRRRAQARAAKRGFVILLSTPRGVDEFWRRALDTTDT